MDGGGAQRQLALLAAHQVQAGHKVHVGLLARGSAYARLEESGAEIHRIAHYGKYDPSVLLGLVKLVGALRPDLVHTWLTRMDVLGGVAAQVCRLPWVISERASALYYPKSLKNWVRSRVARRANAIVSNSAAGDSYWKGLVGERVPQYIVPNAVPLDEIDRAPADSSFPHVRGPLVLFAGRFVGQKNLPGLLAALRYVIGRSDAVALLCGEGPERPRVESAIERDLPKGRVEIAGYRHDIWTLMKRASVFVSVSFFEGHPNTVLEAMACRSPLVVSDIPEHREFLDENRAWIVDPRQPTDIADAICQALTKPEEAQRRVAAARAKVQAYSVLAAAKGYDDVYHAVLSRTQVRPAVPT